MLLASSNAEKISMLCKCGPLGATGGSALDSPYVCNACLFQACQFPEIFVSFWRSRDTHRCFSVVLLVTWGGLMCFAGLQILYTLLQNVAQEETAAQSFYQTYFCDILQHIFSVVTDTSHTAGKNAQM